MIRACTENDFNAILEVVNDAAQAYRGVIPADRWKDPYMSADELRQEIADGVRFSGYQHGTRLVGVMGIQHVKNISLIRHAYVAAAMRRQGIGAALLEQLRKQTACPLLVGTWAAATWATRFYEKHGFRLVSEDEKTALLRQYWNVPERQIETSVVLADPAWFQREQTRIPSR